MTSISTHPRYELTLPGGRLSLEKLWLFVSNHPAQLELADLMTTRRDTPFAKIVRANRELLEAEHRKDIAARWPEIATDPDDFYSVVIIEHSYNLSTDRGETLVSAALDFRKLVDVPGPQVGAIPTVDLVVEGFTWKDIYPNLGGSYLNSKSAKRAGGKRRSPRSRTRSH
jgi:hypothetical protein